jgi:hypothetical protein
MAYTYTLADARNSLPLKNISGVCSTSSEFVALLNEAMERLMDRGNWFDTEWIIRMCAYNGCITWPRYVGTVLGVKFCNMHNSDVRNNWFEIIGPRMCGSQWSPSHTVRDAGTGPTYNDLTGDTGKYIRLYPAKLEDAGKTVTLYGDTTGLQPLQEKVGSVWQRGLTLTLKAPYVQSTVLVRRITSVVRQGTQANVLAYEVDPAAGYLRDIALWEPSETNPRYRKSIVQGFNCLPTACAETDGVRYRTFDALVKLAFIPVVAENDFLAIDNFPALKFAIQAIRLEEANQDETAELKLLKAVDAMNMRDRNKSPSNQMVVRVDPTPYLTNIQ